MDTGHGSPEQIRSKTTIPGFEGHRAMRPRLPTRTSRSEIPLNAAANCLMDSCDVNHITYTVPMIQALFTDQRDPRARPVKTRSRVTSKKDLEIIWEASSRTHSCYHLSRTAFQVPAERE